MFNISDIKYFSLKKHLLTPIFILGLPRSGTTSTENIISSHSKVYGGGELDGIQNIGNQLLNTPKFNSINNDTILKFKEYYLESLPKLNKEILYMVQTKCHLTSYG